MLFKLKFFIASILFTIFFSFLTTVAIAADSVLNVDNALLLMESKTNIAFMDSGGAKISKIDFDITSEVYGSDSLNLEVDFQFTVDGNIYEGTGTWSSNESIGNDEILSEINFGIELTFDTKTLLLDYCCNGNVGTGNTVETINYSHDSTTFHDDISTSILERLDGENPIKTTTINHSIIKNGSFHSETAVIEEKTFPAFSNYSSFTSSHEIISGGDTTLVEIKGGKHNESDSAFKVSIQKYDITKNGVKTHTLTTGPTEVRMSLMDLIEVPSKRQGQVSPQAADLIIADDVSALSIDEFSKYVELKRTQKLSTVIVEDTNDMVSTSVQYDPSSENDKRLHCSFAVSLKSLVPEEEDIKYAVSTSIDVSEITKASILLRSNSGRSSSNGGWFDGGFALTKAILLGMAGGAVAGTAAALQNPAAWANLPVAISVGAITGAIVFAFDAYITDQQRKAFENALIDRVRSISQQTHTGAGTSLSALNKILLTLIVLTMSVILFFKNKRNDIKMGFGEV